MKKFLTTVHRWLGFPLGLLFVVTFGTGGITAVDELLQRLDQALTNRSHVYRPTTTAEKAAALEHIVKGKTAIDRIVMPTESTPYYRVVVRGESWTYAIDNVNQLTHDIATSGDFFDLMLQLHRNYLLGREGLWGVRGSDYTAWVGLFALLLSLLGLWIWWPLRARFTVGDVVPRGKRRKHFYYSHLTSGVVTLLAILLLALTGASITYRNFTQQLFGLQIDRPSAFVPIALERQWQIWLDEAYAQMPVGAQLIHIQYPRQPAGVGADGPNNKPATDKVHTTSVLLDFRFSTPSDWFGLARSSVKIDETTSTLVEVDRFQAAPFNEKIHGLLKPLHTGRDLSVPYVVILLAFSVLGFVMVFSGLVSFMIKPRKSLRQQRRSSLNFAKQVRVDSLSQT